MQLPEDKATSLMPRITMKQWLRDMVHSCYHNPITRRVRIDALQEQMKLPAEGQCSSQLLRFACMGMFRHLLRAMLGLTLPCAVAVVVAPLVNITFIHTLL